MASTAASRHLVAVPFPGRGHINPMLAVCSLLVAADGELTVTVVVTEEWHSLLASAGVLATLPASVSFATIPNVVPSEHGRGDDHAGFIEAVHAKMGEPVERLLDRLVLERRPDAVVVDTYLTWGVDVGARRGIPVCSLWTMAATFFWALYHIDLWPPVDGRESDQELECKSLEQYVPGLSSVRLSDIKFYRSYWEQPLKLAAMVLDNVRKAQCVLFTSFYELEHRALDRITQGVPFPVYPVGPSVSGIPSNGDPGNGKIRDEEHRAWLDAQPESSVLYVSFGSVVSVAPSQLEEVAMALRDSGVGFFWVVRDDKARAGVQQIAGGKGLVVPWAGPGSVGGFLSHCGWNSVLEAVVAGVPLIAFPFGWDGRIVADETGIGINLWEQRRREGGGSGRAATKLMDPNDGESQEMRRRASRLREACRGAVQECGSSRRSSNSFVKDLAGGRLNCQ
ncbi:hypothetical protein GUJ93_ZPchr0001g30806 [Zizania palustris]|uniref:Glycosyltransferase n=1 Tax=Zizania palustris TaxID=103762 RepID=A0A8J5RUQ9_ZIZPA|nr:hypothetical protein GUJ93_ZPchr0001g30806 [Zizania palustris]